MQNLTGTNQPPLRTVSGEPYRGPLTRDTNPREGTPMDHHRKIGNWLLVAASCAFIAAVTAGYGADVFDGVSATAQGLVWLAGR